MNEMNTKKLGRKAVVVDSRTLKLSKYFSAALPPPPAARDWTRSEKTFGEMLNSSLGCCTIAGIGHAIQIWTANTKPTPASITDTEILEYYESWDGYDPKDPSTDSGGICLQVLKNFVAQGFAGHQLKAFATVLPATTDHVKQAINLFGGLYIGMGIPAYIMPDSGDVPTLWKLAPKADNTIVGGHCVFVTGYDAHTVTFISWGSLYSMQWNYWNEFVDESYALLSADWIFAQGGAPNGFSLTDLESDLVLIQ